MDNCCEILSLREKLAAMIEAKNLVQCEVARLVKERDELIERLKSAHMALDDMRAHCEEFKAEARRLKEELGNANEYGDCEHNYADCLKLEIKQARQERDEARKCAEEIRELYAAEVDESKKAFPWPWEAQNERG